MLWTQWQPLETAAEYDGPATYQLRLVNDSRPTEIPRFLGFDGEGILLIGETQNMDTRRNQFICGLERCYGHSAGNLLYYLRHHTPLMSIHPKHLLQYRFCMQRNKQDARLTESRLIKAYVRQFGEVPPLNTSIPDRYDGWAGAE